MSIIITLSSGTPYFNPFFKYVKYSYPTSHSSFINHVPVAYNTYIPSYAQPICETPQPTPYISDLISLPTINILAQAPHNIGKSFTVVPMLVVPEENLNILSNAQIVSVSKKKPTLTVRTNNENILHCTPGVRIALENPIVAYNLKTSIIFPSEMSISHDNIRIPIRVGAVIAPVSQETYVSEESPVTIHVVYAIPTKPMEVDYVNNERDVLIDTNKQAVIVENYEGQNFTVAAVEDDSELGNIS